MRTYQELPDHTSALQSDTTQMDKQPSRVDTIFSNLFLFIPFLLVLRITVFLRQRDSTKFTSIDFLALIQIMLVIFTCFLLLLYVQRLKLFWYRCSGNSGRALFWYYIIAGLSMTWSALPKYTIYRALEFLSQFSAVFLAISLSKDYFNAEKKVLLVTIIIIFLGTSPIWKQLGAITLAALHNNTYSTSATMLFCYCLGEYLNAKHKRKRLLRNFGVAGLFLVIIGTSAASNIATVAGVAVLALLTRNRYLVGFVFCGVIIGLLTLSMHDIVLLLFPDKSDAAIISLGGRIHIWNIYFDMIKKQPWLGYGFASSTRMAIFYTTNTHNGLIAVLLGTGLLGMVFFGAFLWRLSREIIQNLRNRWSGSFGCSAALTAAIVNNMSVSFIGEQWTTMSMTFTCYLALHMWFINSMHNQQTDKG